MPDVVLTWMSECLAWLAWSYRKLLASLTSTLRIIAVTVCDEEPFPTALMRPVLPAGYVTKGCRADEMVTAIPSGSWRAAHYIQS